MYEFFTSGSSFKLFTKVLYKSKSGILPCILCFIFNQKFSLTLNSTLHIITDTALHAASHNAQNSLGIINVGAHHTNTYLTTLAVFCHVDFVWVFASIHFFTISGATLVSSIRFLIPGIISSNWLIVALSRFNILFLALSFTVLSLFSNSLKVSKASDRVVNHLSIVLRSLTSHCSSINLLNASLKEFSNALLRQFFQYVSSFHLSHHLFFWRSASDFFSNLNCLFMKSSMYFISHISPGLASTPSSL